VEIGNQLGRSRSGSRDSAVKATAAGAGHREKSGRVPRQEAEVNHAFMQPDPGSFRLVTIARVVSVLRSGLYA
jgi:hypothetical protein